MVLQRWRTRKAFALLGWLLFSGAVWACAAVYMRSVERTRDRELRAEATLVAQMLEQNLLRTLESIESVHALAQAQADLSDIGADRGVAAIREHLAILARAEKFGILQVAFIDRNGWLAWSSVPGFEPTWLGDREHFLVQRDSRPGLFLSRPLVGRASGRWSVQLTRPLLDMGGGFNGVVVVSLDPIALSRSMSELGHGSGYTLSVLRTLDGTLLATSLDPEARLAQATATSQPIIAALRTNQHGVLPDPVLIQNSPAVVAYRRMQTAPIVVVAAVSTEEGTQVDALRRWVDGASLSVIVLAGLILVLFQQREARRRSRAELVRLDAERVAAESAQRYAERLIGGLPAAVYSGRVRPNGEFVDEYLSASASRLTHWPQSEISGSAARRSKIELPKGATMRGFFRRALQAGENVTEYGMRRPDGGWMWLRDGVRVLDRYEDGSADVVGSITDITNERLLQAQASAAGKLATLGEMATGLAHELNQPIAVMSLAAENAAQALGQKGAEAIPGVLRRLGRIADQAARVRAIIDHLRIFGRSDGGPLEPVAIQATLDAALTLVGFSLRAADIELVQEVAENLPLVLARAIPVEQVLVNLLLNARDSLEEGHRGPGRKVRIESRISDTGMLELIVVDNGAGISPEAMDRLFEPFFTTKEPGKGTGLGLSICHGIMKAMGGEIAARNRAGWGAEFVLRFRLASTRDTTPQLRTTSLQEVT